MGAWGFARRCAQMNNATLMRIPFVPYTQMPKEGYVLMDVDTECVVARACPFHLLLQSNWGKKHGQENGRGDSKNGLFEYIASQHVDEKLEFSQGLFAVGAIKPYDPLMLDENDMYKLVFTAPKTEHVQEHIVHIRLMHMHKNNTAAWVWLE